MAFAVKAIKAMFKCGEKWSSSVTVTCAYSLSRGNVLHFDFWRLIALMKWHRIRIKVPRHVCDDDCDIALLRGFLGSNYL